MMSEAVATPGSQGAPAPSVAAARASVSPGETMPAAPASSDAWTCDAWQTVPASTVIDGSSRAMRSMQSSDASVRSVTSMTPTPPSCSAWAVGTAFITSRIVTTGMTGERASS